MFAAGVDIGSTATKCAILDENKNIVGRGLCATGANVIKAAQKVFKEALDQAGANDWDVAFTVGTGYGRFKVPFGNTQVTEIGCHARGAHFLFPKTKTILDIGGQDTKAIRVAPDGSVADFCMNDKCAAGTGRFLEAAGQVMELKLEDLGELSLKSTTALKITNVCTVFVETEIMSLLMKGRKREDVLAGVHNSIAGRSLSLLRRVGLNEEITFTGGVSRNIGMVKAMEEKTKMKVNASPDSQYIGAIGAALFAWDRAVHGDRDTAPKAGQEVSA